MAIQDKPVAFVAQVQIFIPAADIEAARDKAYFMLKDVPYTFFQVVPAEQLAPAKVR